MTNFWDTFTGFLNSLFVPSDDYWTEGPLQQIKNTFENKLGFIEGFKTAFSAMSNTQGQTLNFEFEFMGHSYAIDFSWFNQHRLTIRSAMGTLFYASALLIALRNILHIFGIDLNSSHSSIREHL